MAEAIYLSPFVRKSFPGLLTILPLRVDWRDLAQVDPHRDLAARLAAALPQETTRRAA